TSHGEAITSITTTGTTLTASTADHVVFTMTLNQSTGAWTFTLVNPIEHSPSPIGPDTSATGETSFKLDLSNLVIAETAGGTTIAFSNDFNVTIVDDSLELVSGASSTGSVDEGALTFSSAAGSGDLFGSGTDVGESGAALT